MAPLAVIILLAVVAIVVAFRFERHCLGQLADTSDTALLYFSRRGWFFLIACWIPFGGMVFLCCGRQQ